MVEDIHVISAGMINFMNSGTKDEWALRSYFGRVNYALTVNTCLKLTCVPMELQDLPRAIVGDIFHRSRQDGTFT